jgi:hypothetical protein
MSTPFGIQQSSRLIHPMKWYDLPESKNRLCRWNAMQTIFIKIWSKAFVVEIFGLCMWFRIDRKVFQAKYESLLRKYIFLIS